MSPIPFGTTIVMRVGSGWDAGRDGIGVGKAVGGAVQWFRARSVNGGRRRGAMKLPARLMKFPPPLMKFPAPPMKFPAPLMKFAAPLMEMRAAISPFSDGGLRFQQENAGRRLSGLAGRP